VNPRKFFAELKRRNVYKVAIAYGVVAWLLMQVAKLGGSPGCTLAHHRLSDRTGDRMGV
jgi:hypothetical protein